MTQTTATWRLTLYWQVWAAACAIFIPLTRPGHSASVPPAAISRSPSTLSASVQRGEQGSSTFEVWNSGPSGSTLCYTITAGGWTTVYPRFGRSTGEHDTITVFYSTRDLAAGVHSATITISDQYASNNPVTVDVSLTVSDHPPTILRAGEPVSGQTFYAAFSSGKTGAYYRDRLGLEASKIEDLDEYQEWQESGYGGPWMQVLDESHPPATWSFNPPGTISAPGQVVATCEWTDDDIPPGGHDSSKNDSVTIIVCNSPDGAEGFSESLMRWMDPNGTECAAIDEAGNLLLRGELKTGGDGGDPSSSFKNWVVRDDAYAARAWLQLSGVARGNLNIDGTLHERYSWGSPLPNHPFLAKQANGNAVASIDASGNLYVAGSVQSHAYTAPLPGEPVSFESAVADSKAMDNAHTLLSYAAAYTEGIVGLDDLVGDPNDPKTVQSVLNDFIDPTKDFLSQPMESGWSREPKAIAYLAFTYLLLKDYWDATQTDNFFETLHTRAYTYLYSLWPQNREHEHSNSYIRVMAGFTLGGVVLQHDDAQQEYATELVQTGLDALDDAFVELPDIGDKVVNYWKSYSDPEADPNGAVTYTEGAAYSEYAGKIMAALLYFLVEYPLPTPCQDCEANRATIFDRYRRYLSWICETQRPDGLWFPQNDSGLLDNYESISMLYHVFSGDRALRDQLSYVCTKMADSIYAPIVPPGQGWNTRGIWEGDAWLDNCLFGIPRHEGDPPAELRQSGYLYPKGGQLFLKSSYNPEDPRGDNSIVGAFYNEGSWGREGGLVLKPEPRFDAFPRAQQPLYCFWEAMCDAFLRAGEKTEVPHEPPPVGCKEVTTTDHTLKLWCHKRYNDTHFEIFAYGKSLLIGPGCMDYLPNTRPTADPDPYEGTKGDPDDPPHHNYHYLRYTSGYPGSLAQTEEYGYWPYDKWNDPRAHNMLRVDGYYPKTYILSEQGKAFQDKIFALPSTWNAPAVPPEDAHLYKMVSDAYTRFIVWSQERYFIIFDQVNAAYDKFTSAGPQDLQLRLHGRGYLDDFTNQTDYGSYVWKYGQRHDNMWSPWPAGYPVYGDRDYVAGGRDAMIKLLVYAGNPMTWNTAALTTGEILRNDPFGRDTGERDDFANEAPGHNFYSHDVLQITTQTGKPQNGMVTVFWPQNDHLTGDTAHDPVVHFQCQMEGATTTIDSISVEVAYQGEGLNFNETWHFDMTGVIDDMNDIYVQP